MSNLPHELLFSLLVFSLLGFGLGIGALRIRPRLLAGLCGMIASFIIVPGKLLGATLIDMRMAMAIAAASLAVLQEAPAAVGSRVEAFRNLLVAAAVAARLALLTVFWTPLQPLNSVYSELARLIEDGSAVFFVAPQDERESVDFWHLHMLAFSGRDVHLSQMFFNFTVDLKPTARFRAPETPVNGRFIADVLSTDPYAYVLSHEDLSTLHISGKRLCLLREHSSVRLYRTLSAPQAGSAKPTSCESD